MNLQKQLIYELGGKMSKVVAINDMKPNPRNMVDIFIVKPKWLYGNGFSPFALNTYIWQKKKKKDAL